MKKWIIRLLLTLIALFGLIFGGLNMLSGTGDAQKGGLEDAFGKALGATVHFDRLEAFNILPQFTVEISGFHASYPSGEGDIDADHVAFSFNLLDLILKKRTINRFEIENANIHKGGWFDKEVIVENTELLAKENNSMSGLAMRGKYGDRPLTFNVSLEQKINSVPPSFFFGENNQFELAIGSTHVKGMFSPFAADRATLQNLSIDRSGKSCAALGQNNRFTMQAFTSNIFSLIAASDENGSDLDSLCQDIMRYGLSS